MKLLILIRGVPGSGKSTLAEALVNEHELACNSEECRTGNIAWFEADMWFCRDGKYKFDPQKLPEAHAWCQAQTEKALHAGVETVIVSNCFVKRWELSFYIAVAADYGYNVQEITVKARFGNIHGVPAEKLEQMKRRFEF